jgi:hypothetical protein
MLEQLRGPGAAFSFFQTADGAEIDLVVQRSAGALGYEFKSALSVSPKDASGLRAGLAAGASAAAASCTSPPARFPSARVFGGMTCRPPENVPTPGGRRVRAAESVRRRFFSRSFLQRVVFLHYSARNDSAKSSSLSTRPMLERISTPWIVLP